MFGCQHGRAPQYLIDYCLVYRSPSWRHGSTFIQTVGVFWSYSRRAFAVAGTTDWNSFLDNLRDQDVTMDNFKRLLKTFLFSAYQCN